MRTAAFERGDALGFNATQVTFLHRALVVLAPAWVLAVECAAGAAEPQGKVTPAAEAPDGAAPTRWHPRSRPRPQWMSDRMYGYLTRPLNPSARHLDHGVLQAAVAGGVPHRYRLELSVGLFDHLTLGVTAHWLPEQTTPRVSPRVAIAFYRWEWVELGALHFWSMYPPPVLDADPATPSFQREAQWFLGTMTFGQRFISAGVDAGALRARQVDDSVAVGPDLRNASRIVWHFGGGLHLRAGTRRWGFTAQAHVPHLAAEVVFDVRFGAFELRPRGGWRATERVWSTDRRFPRR